MGFFAQIKILDDGGTLIASGNPFPVYLPSTYLTGNNLNTILQALSASISSNSQTQLNVTQFQSDGTEGTLLESLAAAISSNSNSQLNVTQFLANGNEGFKAADSQSVDAFGRWRTSETGQRADVEFIYNKQPDIMDEVTAGGGTVAHDATARDVVLSVVDANNGTEASFYQHWHNPYTPGNSQLVDITGTLDGADIGGGTASIFLKDGITSTETEVTQTSWNKDTVADVDWGTSQIFSVDFQSLKVGRLRFCLVRDGISVCVHEITNDNVRAKGFWQYPSLPLAWRIYNTGGITYAEMGYFNGSNGFGLRYKFTANASATMRAICGTVKSEGGKALFDMPGFKRGIDMGVTTATVSTTLIPLISIRPATTFNSIANYSLAIPDTYTVQTDNPIRLVVVKNGTLTGPSFGAVDATNSMMQYDVTASAIANGIVLLSEYIGTGSKNSTVSAEGFLGRSVLAYGLDSVQDILSICAVRTSGTDATVLAGLDWREIR